MQLTSLEKKKTHANTLSCSDAETPKKENIWRSWQKFRAEIRERRRHLWCLWCALIWTNWLLHHRINRRMLTVLTASNTQVYPHPQGNLTYETLQTKPQNKTLFFSSRCLMRNPQEPQLQKWFNPDQQWRQGSWVKLCCLCVKHPEGCLYNWSKVISVWLIRNAVCSLRSQTRGEEKTWKQDSSFRFYHTTKTHFNLFHWDLMWGYKK